MDENNDIEKHYNKSADYSVKGEEDEGERKKKESMRQQQFVPFYKLFSFADSTDVLLMILGTAGALANGVTVPILSVLLGNLSDAFGRDADVHHVIDKVTKVCLQYVYLSFWTAIASFFQISCWMIAGQRQASRIRRLYLKALLSQEIAFFDIEASIGESIGNMTGNTILIQDAISEKVGDIIELITTVFGGFILAFMKGWILTLATVSVIIPMGLCIYLMSKYSFKMAMQGIKANAEASNIIQQTVSSIRTVASFAGEELSAKKYEVALKNVCRSCIQEGLFAGIFIGFISLLTYSSLSLGFWYGAKMIFHKGYSGGTVISVVISIMMSCISIPPIPPCMAAFATGKAAAHKIFETINRKTKIDASDTNGTILSNIHGNIEFKNVCFSYPSRPDEKIFKDLSFVIQGGTTVALVGGSGSGKSTVISLIERFYDPQQGEILIDGINLKQFQLKWLRGKIGHVSQEPALFSSSIRDNITCGKDNATIEEITTVVKLANASTFLNKLPQGLDTMVGERGIQLSGGQKQRIALARAILKYPRIILLDEATSALDIDSEKIIQENLEKAMLNCTTIIVAHRLSTVRNASSIVVMHQGAIAERGSHSELLKNPNGGYSKLIRSQEEHQNLQKSSPCDKKEGNLSTTVATHWKQKHSFKQQYISEYLSFKQDATIKTDKPSMKSNSVPLSRLAYLNKQEMPHLMFGSIAAIASGLVFPIYALLLSKVVKTFYEPLDKLEHRVIIWSIMYLILGVVSLVAIIIRTFCFSVAGAKLIKRIRLMTFEKVVSMEISWFDDSTNSSGAINTRLSTDAATIKNLVGDSLAMLVQTSSTLISGLTIGFIACWQLALLALAMVPIVILNGRMKMKICKGFIVETKKMYEEAGLVANDALGSIRTVASLSVEEKVLELYTKKCKGPEIAGIKHGVVSGIAYGASYLIIYCAYATNFYVGGLLVGKGKTTIEKVFQAFFAISMSAIDISRSFSQRPDFDKAQSVTNSIFAIIDRKPPINSSDNSGLILAPFEGNIEFKNVTFRYPTRPNVDIFHNLCFYVQSGKTVALVGESGSGKSTIIALLQRFYDPNSGKILLDGTEIEKLQLHWLRQQMGLVSQEPTLFNDTIEANIAYGMQGRATEAEIIAASKSANAHTFISNLKQGYRTVVGEQGVKLSGGQKQRVAIARAIAKQPQILLLDEATSALDTESELIVQAALDNVMVNRTTVIIAHRLGTIKNADLIVVMKNGVIVESGKHEALVNVEDGVYASMAAVHSNVRL